MVDQDRLDRMLSNLRSYVDVLRELAGVPRESFLGNRDQIGNAKYHFVISIEACIDIANHIIASERFRVPRDFADSFDVLVEQGIIGEERRDGLRAMARFRNRLVHLYSEIDDSRVHDYLRESLADLDAFARAVAGHDWNTS